jgi:hypothetical protein
MQIDTDYGGSMIHWNEPHDHQREMLTVSYARPPAEPDPASRHEQR